MSARLRFPELLRGSRSLAVSPSGSILNLAPTWAIDARRGDVDLVGTADPSPVRASLLDPADGAVQVVSMDTNETGDGVNSTGSYLWTADTAANSVTGDIDIRAKCRAFDDVTNNGFVPQTIKVAKYLGDVVNTFDYLFAILNNGDMRLGGSGLAATVDSAQDVYASHAYRITRVAATGVVEAFIEDTAGATTTADGRKWTSLGTTTDPAGNLNNTTNAILTFMVGKGVGGWCQVYDGIDGTLVVDMDIERDAPPGLVATDTFTAGTGETWTLNEACATFAVDRAAWVAGVSLNSADGPFIVADADAVDITTSDFTAAIVYEPSALASGPLDFRTIFFKANPGTIGAGGVGWGFGDYSPLGGVLFALNDGSGMRFVATSWTAGERHLIVATGDRDGNLSLYLDDMTSPAATTDISSTTGTLANTDNVTSSNAAPALLAAAAKWDRVLTAGELAKLPTLMGV